MVGPSEDPLHPPALREDQPQRTARADRFLTATEGEEALGRVIDVRDVALSPPRPEAAPTQPERPRASEGSAEAAELARSRWQRGYRR